MPLVQTRGAASAQGFGEFAQAAPAANYIEDVFSTYLYTGTGSAITVNNGVDLSGKGGLTWLKTRSNIYDHYLIDTVRGNTKLLVSNDTAADDTDGTLITAFNSNGFSVGTNPAVNTSARTYVSWSFREQAKFFDIVTYTGNGDADRNISHNLDALPGMIIIKKTSGTGNWATAASLNSTAYGIGGGGSGSGYEFSLNNTQGYYDNPLKSTIATSTTVNVPRVYYNNATVCNASGATYVMYLFASDAGGFGTTGTDNVISCGAFSGNTTVTLGYEPQFVMVRKATGGDDWYIHDTMRNWPVSGDGQVLKPNTSAAESGTAQLFPNATGFSTSMGAGQFIYMAIRRPMKVPTTGTSVFSPITSAGTTGTTLTTGFPVDFQISTYRGGGDNRYVLDRLRGINTTGIDGQNTPFLRTNGTNAETANTNRAISYSWDNTSFKNGGGFGGLSTVFWSFRRAPGFFDVVCYTGNGTYGNKNHNLTVVPELIISKKRSGTGDWYVWLPTLNTSTNPDTGYLNSTAAFFNYWSVGTIATSTTFAAAEDDSGATYVAYLFATCAGVSKVGSYTGTAAAQTINCGFTAGARFVMIKRTDSTGDWYVWDTARGIISGDDPYLLLNSTAAEVTNTDYIDPASSGFEISSTAPAAINASGGTFIFLAIA